MVKSRVFLGMGDLPPLIVLIMGPYKPLRNWVDFPIPYYMEIMGVDRPWLIWVEDMNHSLSKIYLKDPF